MVVSFIYDGNKCQSVIASDTKNHLNRFEIPRIENLHQFWNMFFEIPQKNLPLAHERSRVYQIPGELSGFDIWPCIVY